MNPWLAHSPKGKIPAQTYEKHVGEVVSRADANAQALYRYARDKSHPLLKHVVSAALLHDLGKLDDLNQEVLSKQSRDPLRIAHEDAGVAALLTHFHQAEAAVLVAGHHKGLFDYAEEAEKENASLCFRDLRVVEHVDGLLKTYLARHGETAIPLPGVGTLTELDPRGLPRRLALSCLVDADHSDTAHNYDPVPEVSAPNPQWARRRDALDRYVASLHRPTTSERREHQRQSLRDRVYHSARSAPISPALRSCDAPVGIGKTTAVMSHLLAVAEERELRHVFVVLPYTNIIRQAVEVYRKALVLEGEDPELIVAEHHHQVEFGSVQLRQYATLWRAPIIVTTAVQFFQTLSGYHPAALRKFHELPGSAVFIDEAHAAMPAPLWPSAWNWMRELTEDWGAHFVLGSGSLPRFWESSTFQRWTGPPPAVPDLVETELRDELHAAEQTRISAVCIPEALTLDQLIGRVLDEDGPRLVILNTVQSAAVVAHRMRERGQDVMHLSTALAPAHREVIVERIKARLRHQMKDWTLVATSCVEAGMDFSFRTGFRERANAASLIQIGGRISRSSEHEDARVWDFRIVEGEGLRKHPAFDVSGRVLAELFQEGAFESKTASEIAGDAMRRELTDAGGKRAEGIQALEEGMQYPEVARQCQIITDDTRLVVVDPELIADLKAKRRVDPKRLQRFSVRIWATKLLRRMPVQLLVSGKHEREHIYEWLGEYDPDFVGYMSEIVLYPERYENGAFIV